MKTFKLKKYISGIRDVGVSGMYGFVGNYL